MPILLGRAECNSLCKRELELQWQEEWKMSQRGRHFFSIQPSVNSERWRVRSRKRRDGVVLTRLRLGHCGLAGCLRLVGKHQDGLCECGSVETVNHVVLKCNKYNRERRQLFKELSDLGLSVFSLQSIFRANQNTEGVAKAVLKFLHSTGLYMRI